MVYTSYHNKPQNPSDLTQEEFISRVHKVQ